MSIDLDQFRPPRLIHLVGMGGDGMTSLAGLLLDRGFLLTGSETAESIRTKQPEILERFHRRGVSLHHGHQASNVAPAVGLIVRSSAVGEANPEVVFAQANGIPVVKRAEMLGALMHGSVGIAVAGTAGKTTTTAMLGFALQTLGADPTISLGGRSVHFGDSNYRSGRGHHFVAEADEYDRSFLQLPYRIAIITHLFYGDHPDTYSDLSELLDAFAHFASRVEPDGLALGCGDVEEVRSVVRNSPTSQTYGFDAGNDWRIIDLQQIPSSTKFTFKSRFATGSCRLTLPGRHNVLNALAVVACTWALGFRPQDTADILADFEGCSRRLELRGDVQGIKVYDDYGHHPIQIAATLAAVRQRHPQANIHCIFEPRQFWRTKLAMTEYSHSFREASTVIVTDISYGLAESSETVGEVDSGKIVELLRKDGLNGQYVPSLAGAAEYLAPMLKPGDVVVATGTGKTYNAAIRILEILDQGAV